MSRFKLEIGKWIDYWPDGSLDDPDDPRQGNIWAKTSSGSPVVAIVANTSTSVPNDFHLRIDTSNVAGTDEQLYYGHATGTAPFYANVNNTRGYTIEAQVEVIDAKADGGQVIYWDDGTYKEYLIFYSTYIKLGLDATTYSMTTTDNYYTYRIRVQGTEVKVYVNEVLRITGALATAAAAHAPAIYFGDYFATFGGECRYGKVRYNTDAPLAPSEDWSFKEISIQDRRGFQERNIIRSHNSIIKEGKMRPARIRFSGTVAGSDYPSFSDAIRRLKRLLHSGTQRIYVDEERFIDALHSAFQLSPITQDYAEISIDFTCRYPFWQENWASYFTTAPVNNGTFYIVNNSDIEVPIKLIVTGRAAGTISNDIRLKNLTADQDALFTAVLAQTQELIIDKGFDIYNTYAVKIGTASSFGSYQGDLFTLKPGENRFVYLGATPAGTLEFYWHEAFLQ